MLPSPDQLPSIQGKKHSLGEKQQTKKNHSYIIKDCSLTRIGTNGDQAMLASST